MEEAKKFKRISYINRAQVKRLLLRIAHDTGRTKFKRVRAQTLDDIEGSVRVYCANVVHRAPSLGKTL